MTPAPDLQELIDVVRADAAGCDALDQLAQASRTVAGLEEAGDALLGHFVDQCRRSGRSWSEISAALGVSKQAAHKRFSAGAPTFERFTERARAVLSGAADQARSLGSGHIGPEHLLLALFEPASALAAQVLAEAGVTRSACEEQVLGHAKTGARPDAGPPGFNSQAVEVLRGAVEEALRLGHDYVGTEHLLLALFRNPDDIAAKVLTSLSVRHDDIRRRLIEKLAGIKETLTAHPVIARSWLDPGRRGLTK
jgi:hypothetical protein